MFPDQSPAAAPQPPARAFGVVLVPPGAAVIRLPSDAARFARLADENRILTLVNRAVEGEVIVAREENARLVALLAELRERLADEERGREAALARLRARRRPSRLAAWWAACCLWIDAAWSQDMTPLA